MPKSIRFCLWSLALAPTVILVLSFYNETVAVDLARTFLNGETAIGFWIKHGTPFWAAVFIAVLCSTWDTAFWFCGFNAAHWAIEKIESLYRRSVKKAKPIYGNIPHSELAGVKDSFPEIKRECFLGIYSWGKKIYLFFNPQPQIGARVLSATLIRYYFVLPIFGAMPGFIWSGIQYSRALRLNQAVSFSLISAGNALKMVIAAYASLKIGAWGVVFVVTGFAAAKLMADRFRKK